mmetsp:Transcript_14991/g.17975  ORF Transcript_14991/g.17975 Transcript_14991/m.17975 type:complete len:428 (-) Transcript_14991:141-1424(-)
MMVFTRVRSGQAFAVLLLSAATVSFGMLRICGEKGALATPMTAKLPSISNPRGAGYSRAYKRFPFKWNMMKRPNSLYSTGTVGRHQQVAAASSGEVLNYETDTKGRTRLAFKEEGWNTWNWNGNKINYIESGESGTPILLVHGFGAHAYHWRYQIPELSKKHRVYSLCLLGYGWSDKSPHAPYSAEFWASQVADFVKDVIQEKTVLVGNSIGAVTSLATASIYPDLVQGLVMVNAAGRFGDMDADVTGEQKPASPSSSSSPSMTTTEEKEGSGGVLESIQETFKDIIAAGIFYSTRFRIPLILKNVYLDPEQVDDDLVKSITTPALDPNALGTFQSLYRAPFRGKLTVNDMMASLPQDMKVLLLWGQQDPWMQPEKAHQIMRICDKRGLECDYVPLAAGHCPQDDNPEDLNESLMRWVDVNFSEVAI